MAGKTPKPNKIKKNDVPIYTAANRVTIDPLGRGLMEGLVVYEGGNGKAGFAHFNQKGLLHRMILPHARVQVAGDRIDRVSGDVIRVPHAEFDGVKWGYSDAIWHITGKRIDTFQATVERYGSPEHVFPLLVMMAENDLPDGAYRVVVSVPPGYYGKVAEKIVEGFQRGNAIPVRGKKQHTGIWEIRLSKDGLLRRYSFDEVAVLMEAADAGYAALRYSFTGELVKTRGQDGQDMLGGRVKIIDLGFGTCDTPVLINGALLEEGIARASDAQGGILHNIARPVMESVIEKMPDVAEWITAAHVDYWLRRYVNGYVSADDKQIRGWTPEAGQVSIMGKMLHLAPAFDHYAETYARYAWRQVIQAQQENSDLTIALGGGWLYVFDHIMRWHKESNMVMQFASHINFPHLKNFSFIEINLIGLVTAASVMFRSTEPVEG